MSPMTPISPISKTMNTTLKYLYFALAIVALSACQVIPENEQILESFTPADTSQIKRTSLLIEYSGWRCMNCPNAAAVAHDLQEQYGEELVVVVMHPASNPNTRYGNNQSVNYTCPEADSVYIRMGGTNATPFPTGNINFLQQENSFFCGSDTWATLLSRYYGSSPIIMKQTLAHENNAVDIEIYLCNMASKPLNTTLQIWLTEDGIVGKQIMPDGKTNNEYKEGDEFKGIDVEIAGAIAEKLGMELRIENMEFDSIIESVKGGKADMGLAGMTVTAEGKQVVNFTASYATGVQVVIVTEDSAITSVDDLFAEGAMHVIGVQRNTTGDLYSTWDLEDAGLATIDRYSKGADAVQALITGKVDCVVIDNEPAKAFVEALSKGYTYATQNPKEAADILMEATPELKSNSELVYASQEYLASEYIADASKWGEFDPERWAAFYNWLNEKNLLEDKIDPSFGFTNDYLPE